MSEPTQAKIIKEKKPRSEEQLAVLAEARKKASSVRAENAMLRKQERDMEKDLKAKAKEERMAKVKAHQESKKKPVVELQPETDFMEEEESEDEEIVVRKKPKAKPKVVKKKKVRVVYESESDEELQEEPTRKTRIGSDTPPAPLMTPAQLIHQKLYKQMFSM